MGLRWPTPPIKHLTSYWAAGMRSTRPAPIHFGQERGRWLTWKATDQSTWDGDRAAFNLPEAAAKVQARLGWMYWIDEEYTAFNEPDDDRLNDMADNLDMLLKNTFMMAITCSSLAMS